MSISKKQKQLQLIKKESTSYGGDLLKTRKGRSRGRPLDTKNTIHLVLRSSKAKGEWSFRVPKHKKAIEDIIIKFADKYGIKVISMANVGNHLHLQIKLGKLFTYKPFIRATTSAIAMAVTGVNRWTNKDGSKKISVKDLKRDNPNAGNQSAGGYNVGGNNASDLKAGGSKTRDLSGIGSNTPGSGRSGRKSVAAGYGRVDSSREALKGSSKVDDVKKTIKDFGVFEDTEASSTHDWTQIFKSGIVGFEAPKDQKKLKFWDYRPFTRVVQSFKAFLTLKDYILINEMEGFGVNRSQARFILQTEGAGYSRALIRPPPR